MFFSNKDNKQALENFISRANEVINTSNDKDKIISDRLSLATQVIEHIDKSPEDWDKRCTFNTQRFGARLIENLKNFDSQNPESIDNIYVKAYQFLCEFDFLTEGELSMDLSKIKKSMQEAAEGMNEQNRSSIAYASFYMLAEIAKHFIHHPDMVVFKNFEQKKAEAEDYTKKWTADFEKTKKETELLKSQLDEYKTAFNFVGLDKGFSNLKESKSKEAQLLFRCLLAMGFFTLILPCVELWLAMSGIYQSTLPGVNHLAILLPLISMEIILIYFFRIVLLNHKSVKAQIMQIELRQTLCQFIQSYADYSVKIKEKDKDALEKFENLIFSGILTNTEKLPSTFDGIEQLTNIIKSVRN